MIGNLRKTLIFVLLLSLVACSREMYKSRVNKAKPSQGVYQNNNIVNTWCSEEDNNWKLVFTSDYKCYQYYSNTLTETDTYAISNTSPQCGVTVPITNYTCYLRLTNASTGEITCYEINGITEKTLSLRPIDRGGTVLFYRQTISQHKSADIKKYEYKGINTFKGDTLAFIMYNFIDNKSQYINKPASVLFNKLPYDIKSFMAFDVYGSVKTISISYLNYVEYGYRLSEKLKMTDITITFKEEIPNSKIDELKGNNYSFEEWTPHHAKFFENLIVEDIAYFAYK